MQVYHYIKAPHVLMREGPGADQQAVSDARYSEAVVILEHSGGWAKVETVVDRYRGWIERGAICERTSQYLPNCRHVAKVRVMQAHVFSLPDVKAVAKITVPYQSYFKVIEELRDAWLKVELVDQQIGYIMQSAVEVNPARLGLSKVVHLSREFLNIPYTWGGRTACGFDCSGFVQMLLFEAGVLLPRDSKDQCKWDGLETIRPEERLGGDLVFFGRDQASIAHVGMCLGGDEFIHATTSEAPTVHISSLAQELWDGRAGYPFRVFKRVKGGV